MQGGKEDEGRVGGGSGGPGELPGKNQSLTKVGWGKRKDESLSNGWMNK